VIEGYGRIIAVEDPDCPTASHNARRFLNHEKRIVNVAHQCMRNHGIERFVGDIKAPGIAHNELDPLTEPFGRAKALRNLHEASAEVDASDSTREFFAPSDGSRGHAGAASYVEDGTG
jgi:hypothetical protein